MDFQFFTANQQPIYGFQPQQPGMPLTPSHSASSDQGEFHSPPEIYNTDFTANDPQISFDNAYAHQPFNPHLQQQQHPHPQQQPHQQSAAASFVGINSPPTPPNHHSGLQHNQHVGGAPVSFAGIKVQEQPIVQVLPKPEPGSGEEPSHNAGSGSGDDDLTPQQNRRKAQNRAAQRAFRERKERHVKDLEAKLASLEAAQKQTNTENERLKRDIQKISTENEILRATTSLTSPPSGALGQPTTTGPLTYNPTDFYGDLLSGHANKTPSHRIVESEDGERLYAAGATWDMITSDPRFREGKVDISGVSERLRHKARCDGQGPVFAERDIVAAIEESISMSDELL